jgi:hypothetical protein
MLWLFLCCILFDVYESLAEQATYWNPDRTNKIILAIIGFVDDCNGQVLCFLLPQNDETLPTVDAVCHYQQRKALGRSIERYRPGFGTK